MTAPPPIKPNGAADQRLRLSVLEPPELRGRSFDVAAEFIVGRSSGCGVSVPEDNFVSNLHARFFNRENKLWIEDLGSTNGTYLNTHRLAQPAPLRNGDRLRMGRTVFEVNQ
jgi:pSer/pThr/pTyr-binding forkhead associated (FHA) protein